MHVFECPFYNDIRLRFQDLFTEVYRNIHEDTNLLVWNVEFCDTEFKYFMNGNNTKGFWKHLANYLIICRRVREEALNNMLTP